MTKYELLLILPGTFDDNEAQKQIASAVEMVGSYGGQRAETNSIGKMRLSYPIKQIRYGYFYSIVFETEPDMVNEMNEKFKMQKDWLRAVIGKYKSGFGQYRGGGSTREVKEPILPVAPEIEKAKVEIPAVKVMPAAPKTKEISLEDIDKKLDAILDDGSLMVDV